jgi:hypothetical protein
MPEKTKFDRVKESVRLLKGLLENGVSDSNASYKEIKDCLDLWIVTGDEAMYVIEMRTYRYIAHLTLPQTTDKAAELVLKVHKFPALYQ